MRNHICLVLVGVPLLMLAACGSTGTANPLPTTTPTPTTPTLQKTSTAPVPRPGVPDDRGARRRLGGRAVGHPVRHRSIRPVGRPEVRVPRRLRVRDQHAHPAFLPERPAPERLRHRGVPHHPGPAHRHRAAPGPERGHRGRRPRRAGHRLRGRLLPARRPAGPAAGDVPGAAPVRPAGHLGLSPRPARRVQPLVRGPAHRRRRRGHAEPHHHEPGRRDPAHQGPARPPGGLDRPGVPADPPGAGRPRRAGPATARQQKDQPAAAGPGAAVRRAGQAEPQARRHQDRDRPAQGVLGRAGGRRARLSAFRTAWNRRCRPTSCGCLSPSWPPSRAWCRSGTGSGTACRNAAASAA